MRAVLLYSTHSGPQEKQTQSVGVGTNSSHRVACGKKNLFAELQFNEYNLRRMVFLGDRMVFVHIIALPDDNFSPERQAALSGGVCMMFIVCTL